MTNLHNVFEKFNSLKVLIIGDVMIDSYLWGSVNRISPEAPVPIVNVKEREKRLGGAANVARNIKALGAQPILCSVIGNDEDGKELLNLLTTENMTAEGLVTSSERPTTIKHRIISNSQQMLRVDSESTKLLSDLESKDLFERIEKLISEVDVVIFEDYDKGVLFDQLIKKIIHLANDKNIPTVVDPKKNNFLTYSDVTLFKPNLKELKEGLKIDFNSKELNEVIKATDRLIEKLNCSSALITLSELGMLLKSSDGNMHHKQAHIRQIADVSGAGDTVISTAAMCLALELNPEFLVDLANLAGGLVCEYIGVVPINKEQLLQEAQKHKLGDLL